MWRAVVVFRLLALVVAVVGFWRNADRFPSMTAPVLVLVAMTAWTAVVSVLYARPEGRRTRTALADLVVTVAVVGGVTTTQTATAFSAGAPILTSLWVAGPAYALAVARGRDGGLLGGLVVWGAVTALRQRVGDQELFNLVLFGLSAVLLGYAATTTRAATLAVQQAAATAAAAAERERLGRAVHDGVLQVLAAVRRRGEALGEDAADLARLAAEQEVALRGLLSAGPPVDDGGHGGDADLGSTLRLLATPDVQVSSPADPVLLPGRVATELAAAVREALANTAEHAGPAARAWVSLEPGDDEVVVVVRDEGPGIPAGRLAEAGAAGHRGVSSSICGRLTDLGGTAVLHTGPGQGTEWELTVPRERDRR
ncbi:MacS family sensor histidine kinase [Modestobacter sp. Leaf380]|uniref:MacS family sensor histidine kinase n=1 Tax=Modestobacter sp. Leaf380 TaxID=1736356 RepID=UPI0026F46BFF|nr:ATP-binding protein [Modestobacter sp. Leaf380]